MYTKNTTILSVKTASHTFSVGSRVIAEDSDSDSDETDSDGRPFVAEIVKIDWDGTAFLKSEDGDKGWYELDKLTPA